MFAKICGNVYFRYVDDTFVLFSSELDCDCFHDKLNVLHPALTFTVEKEQNNSLSFLDVLVKKRALDFSPAFTGSQHLQGNTPVGLPSAQNQEKAALSKP